MAGSKDMTRYVDRRDGRRAAKATTKVKTRARERGRFCDIAKEYNAGRRDLEDME